MKEFSMNRHASLLCAVAVCALSVGCGGAAKRPYAPAGLPELTALSGTPRISTAHDDIETVEALAKHVEAACAAVGIETETDILVDGPTKFLRWRPENWANPAAVSRKELEGGSACISVDCRKGDKSKWVVTLSQNMDLSQCDSLELIIRSDKPVKLAVGVWTGKPGERHFLFESREVTLNPGDWQKLKVLLEGGFKAAATEWKHTSKIENRANTRAISLLIYGAEPCKIEFRGLSISAVTAYW